MIPMENRVTVPVSGIVLLFQSQPGELNALIPVATPDKPVLVVIDEAVDFFDVDDRGTANREFLSFLRHSRKQATDLIFIA